MAVHFAVMATFSCPLCTWSSKPSIIAQNNRIIECVLDFLRVRVWQENQWHPLTRHFWGTNEVGCACSPPSVCGGLQLFLLLWHSLILLSEGVCAPCPLDGSGRRRSPYVLLTVITHSLFEAWNGVTPSFLVLRVTTITIKSGFT